MVVFVCALLLLSFIAHIIWWRIKMPTNSSFGLLVVFFVVPVVVVSLCYILEVSLFCSLPELVSLVSLYISCALVYVCLYSAIEQCSPTLSIIAHIDSHGMEGCEDACILHHVKPNEEISKRLSIMKQVGWIYDSQGNLVLTKRGDRIAGIFNLGAYILGITKGG